MRNDVDVAIVGAGPTGLILAGDLAAAGIDCVVLERRLEQSNLSRAFVIQSRTLELLDARGIADRMIASGERAHRLRLFGRLAADMSGLPGRYPFTLVIPQYRVEAILRERALELGARIVEGTRVVGLEQDAAGVDLRTEDQRGEATEWRARYAVGADGVHSTVRSELGLSFPGRTAVVSMILADVRLNRPPADSLNAGVARGAFAFLAPIGDGWHRIVASDQRRQVADSIPVDLAEVGEITQRAFGTDFGIGECRWISRFHSDECLVDRYRVGRVFLAGDAAHVDSPAGGQGMNTGLQDAMNLSWKLAAAVRGWAGEDLLESYHEERRPVGVAVRRLSSMLLRQALAQDPALRLLRAVVARTIGRVPAINDALARRVSGLEVAYGSGAGRPAGRRAADVAIAGPGPSRLYEALRAGRLVLVAPAAGEAPDLAPWADRVELVRRAGPEPGMCLVRPDGYIAWAGDCASDCEAALVRWCGAPAAAAPAEPVEAAAHN
ncbi:MAG TPA: FAD-dependent monooxygenase [Candidatus Dormibacteraeota bacterium]|jgi:2-polyprenyl-6-methoxyphenol hydroxylase-like FAD-dependent oxidoreductase|nr:FAD-dependent monooxygenase [Candidatus Dormibacteraeota bacterium]